MRIAIAQINSILGDIRFNKEKILEYVEKAKQKKAELVVFPESCLLGYHPFDLLERRELISELEKAEKDILKKIPKGIAVIFGTITRNKKKKGRPYFNSAILLQKGQKPRVFNKQLLPTGDVFDEARFIENGDIKNNYFQIGKKKFFLTICEDIWAWANKKGESSYSLNPLEQVPLKKVDMVINISASPWFIGKEKLRDQVTQQTAKLFKAPLLYVNLVGAQDEIIFDGESFIVSPKGKTLLSCQKFSEDLNVYDLDTKEVWSKNPKSKPIEELRQALVMGIRDFCQKIGIQKVHLGLSGGIDSAVVAALAVDALGPSNVATFAMPGPHSAPISYELAEKLAKNLGIAFKSIDINPSYKVAAEVVRDTLGVKEFGVTHENLQSRLRGLYLMAYANATNSLLLTTGNKSEYATGYATLYGDMCGGLAPIGDLTKQQVYALAEHYNENRELIPEKIIKRAPSAELRPNQKDQDSLPPYDDLDQAVVNVVEKGLPAKNQTEKWLMQKLVATEFKRYQAAPILKTSSHSFGRGRRWPLAHRGFRKS